MKKILNYLRSYFSQEKSILPAPVETNLAFLKDPKHQKVGKKMGFTYYKRTQKK